MAKLIFNLVITIILAIQVLTTVGAKYPRDTFNIQEEGYVKKPDVWDSVLGTEADFQLRRQDFVTMIGEVDRLDNAIKDIRDMCQNDIDVIRTELRNLKESVAESSESSSKIHPYLSPRNSFTSLGRNNPGAMAGSLPRQGGFAHANSALGNYGPVAAGSSLRDGLGQLVDANLGQQNAGQFGQASSLQNQALSQILSGYKDTSGLNNGAAPILSSASGVPTQLLLSRFG